MNVATPISAETLAKVTRVNIAETGVLETDQVARGLREPMAA